MRMTTAALTVLLLLTGCTTTDGPQATETPTETPTDTTTDPTNEPDVPEPGTIAGLVDVTGGFAGYGHPTNSRVALLDDGRVALLRFALDHDGETRFVDDLTPVHDFVAAVAESGPGLDNATVHTLWLHPLDPAAAQENLTLLADFASQAGDRSSEHDATGCYDCNTYRFYHRDPAHQSGGYGTYLDFEEPWASWIHWEQDSAAWARAGDCWGEC